ncbi:hypothetical protein ACVIKO_005433 [Rhizobium ruizarguesonis]|jgi:hypothetical protein
MAAMDMRWPVAFLRYRRDFHGKGVPPNNEHTRRRRFRAGASSRTA